MSKALDYLLAARPEAMSAYFEFLKAGGRRLDPKTRALITVLTKVATQTDRGLRQYLPKALKAGWSADEILDALLCAFPALGFTKIVWAVEVILAMGLPEFELAALGRARDAAGGPPGDSPAQWHEIARLDAVADGGTARFEAAGRGVFVHREGDSVRVWDSHCPHQQTDMPDSALQGNRLVCTRHQWAFDARTGTCVAAGDRPLQEVEARIEHGSVMGYW